MTRTSSRWCSGLFALADLVPGRLIASIARDHRHRVAPVLAEVREAVESPMMDPCSECGTSVSSLAEVCPRCGVRFKPAPVPPRPLGVLDIGCGVFLGLLAWALLTGFVGFLLLGGALSALSGPTPHP